MSEIFKRDNPHHHREMIVQVFQACTQHQHQGVASKNYQQTGQNLHREVKPYLKKLMFMPEKDDCCVKPLQKTLELHASMKEEKLAYVPIPAEEKACVWDGILFKSMRANG